MEHVVISRAVIIAITLSVGIVSASPAASQMFSAGGGIASQIAMTNLMWQPHRQSVSAAIGKSVKPRVASPAKSAVEANASRAPGQRSTGYRSSPQVSDRVKSQYVAFITSTLGSSAGSQYQAVLDRGNHVTNWAQLVSSDGFRPGDVADALASYWILNWMIANGRTTAEPAYGRAVVDQVRLGMTADAAFARLTDAQRQEMAEALMLTF